MYHISCGGSSTYAGFEPNFWIMCPKKTVLNISFDSYVTKYMLNKQFINTSNNRYPEENNLILVMLKFRTTIMQL